MQCAFRDFFLLSINSTLTCIYRRRYGDETVKEKSNGHFTMSWYSGLPVGKFPVFLVCLKHRLTVHRNYLTQVLNQ